VPHVTRLAIAPVKGLALEFPTQIRLTQTGVAEDRRFFFVDPTGRLVDGLVAGPIVQVAAHTDPDGATLCLTMPDGRVVEDAVRPTEPIVTSVYGRMAEGHVVDGPWAAALEPLAGRPLRLVRTDRPGGTRTEHPTTIVGDGSLAELGRHFGTGPLDARRFRMLIEIDGTGPHEEDTWIGGRVEIGEVTLRISAPVPRCAITTQDPDRGVRDLDTLRTIKEYRGLRDGTSLDFGVWGEVERPGTIRLGDTVAVPAVPAGEA
jgi:uncharacterized protein YcbX